MAELTEFRRLLRQTLSDANFLDSLGIDFWTLAPANTPFVWWGEVEDIPDGWSVCDGTNGTPNMAGKFVLGSATSAGDITEESAAVLADHTVTQPANHVVTQPDAHLPTRTQDPDDTRFVASGSQANVPSADHGHLTPTLAHSGVTVNAHSGVTVDAHTFTSDYVPPSITVIWIMKVEA